MTEFNKWQTFRFDLGSYLLSDSAIKVALSDFLQLVVKPLQGKNTICFMFKIQTDQGFKSITHLQEFNINKFSKAGFEEEEWLKNNQQNVKTLNDLLSLCQESWELISTHYQTFKINYIVFSYKVIPSDEVKQITKKEKLENKFRQHSEALIIKPEPQIFKNHYLPTTMDFTKWGEYELSPDFTSAIIKKSSNKNKQTKIEYHIKIEDYKLLVDLKVGSLTAFSWVDTMIPESGLSNLGTFVRTIKKNTYYFEDGKLQLHTLAKSCRKITTVNKSTYRSKDFITYDIETKTIDGLMIPYCVCLYDGSNYKVFYITDYDHLNLTIKEKSDIMLKDSITFLLKPKYSGYKVYAHNFSYFDGIFLMKFLTEIDGIVKPVIRDGKFIETKIFYDWKDSSNKPEENNNSINENIFKENNNKAKSCKHNISFRDSLLLLPNKLSLLAKTFGVANKDLFPYKFVNEKTTTFDYNNVIPTLQYFNVSDMVDDVSERLQNWKEYRARFNDKNWNLKDETILYCKNDVKILWEILDHYSKIIFENWYVDLMKSPTISSLAFKLFRSNYLPDLDKQKIKIPAITGKIYEDIKKSYTGGAVDVYLPYGENLYLYDINSLYPSVMKEFPMPVGQPKYFEGDIRKYNILNSESSIETENQKIIEQPFGFFEVEITTPEDILNPILQTKLNYFSVLKELLLP
jgi:DNA polymerase type B, organellar and viral